MADPDLGEPAVERRARKVRRVAYVIAVVIGTWLVLAIVFSVASGLLHQEVEDPFTRERVLPHRPESP